MKTRLNKNDLYALGGIILSSAAVMIACVLIRGGVYGSQMDWVSQHYPVPEYFRTLFYDTHQLFPSYAANIGAGENIYSLSYYGLYSPVIMLSYLLPFVPMGYYIMLSGVVTVFISECIFYFYIRKNHCIRVTAFTAAMFAFSVQLIYQSHRHIMFVSFMPFLLLCMHFTDKYFESGRRWPLVLCAFLMIMCNYFFAVTALFALAAYGLARVIDEHKSLYESVKRYLPFVLLLLVSVLMAGVLILPTAYSLLSGRDEGNVEFSIVSFLPTIRLDWLTYYSYSMGLTGFGVYAMIYGLFHAKGSRRFIAALTLLFAVCPLLVFILNGTLYFDAKVLFAFLPLALIVVAWLIDDILQNGAHKMLLPLSVFLIGSLLAMFVSGWVLSMLLYLVDAALTAVIILILRKKHNVYICSLFLVIAFAGCCAKNAHDLLVPVSEYQKINNKAVYQLAEEAADEGIARTAINVVRVDTPNKIYGIGHYSDTIYSSIHSKEYNSFYFEQMYNENEYRNSALTTRSQNLLFNCYMGDRFFVSNKPLDFCGAELMDLTDNGYYLYENKNAYPLIYHNERLMSRGEYDKLEYPANIEALMKYTIVENELPDTGFECTLERADIGDIFDIGDILPAEDTCELKDGVRHIVHIGESEKLGLVDKALNTQADMSVKYKKALPEECRGKLLLIRFYIDNPAAEQMLGQDKLGDLTVIINGVKNKLSNPEWRYFNNNNYFEYVLSDLKDELNIELRGREFEISQLEAYTLAPEELGQLCGELTAFEFDNDSTGGDTLEGSITAPEDGYLATSFVYHEGFKVLVDGEEVTPERINTAFLGIPISRGEHSVKITFRAPFLTAGIIVTAFGLVVFAVVTVLDMRDKAKKK